MSAPHPKAQDNISPLHWFGRKPVPDTPKEAADRLLRVIKEMPEPESEVMLPVERSVQDTPSDTRPLSATGADQINRLDDIATLLRTLTYGEMMELAGAIWKAKPEGELDEKTLPATLHRWAGSRKEG